MLIWPGRPSCWATRFLRKAIHYSLICIVSLERSVSAPGASFTTVLSILVGVGNDLQNIPRAARNRLRLNGQPVAIHDYSAFYPGLLYAMVGATCDGDPYTIPDWPRQISKPILNI